MILAGLSRFAVDFFRYFEPNALTVFGLSFSQLIALGLIMLGFIVIFRKQRKQEPSKQQ